MIPFFIFLLIPSIILEATVTSIPLIFVILLELIIISKQWYVFALAFISGVIVDSLLLRPIGETSIFLLSFLFLVLLYQRKYEIYSIPFIVISSFIGTSIYLLLTQGDYVILQSLICAFISLVLFLGVSLLSHTSA